jgi:N-hydroxyarylamine O-acetyltransferase
LRALGFDVTILLGRVGAPTTRSLNHMLLRVEIEGRPWIADVGYGGEGPIEPIPLGDGIVQQDGIAYSLHRGAHHWIAAMHYAGGFEEMYAFADTPHNDGDVAMANWFTSTHPSSIFRQTVTIQRATPGDRLILRPNMITRYRNGAREDTPIASTQLRHFALELFGIDLGESELLFEKED